MSAPAAPMSRRAPGVHRARPLSAAAFLARASAAVDEHLGDERFGVDSLAAELHVSPRQLRRLFAERTGQTPRAFLRERRMARARMLLCDEALPVADVARAVGYADSSAFGRAFRGVTGSSPNSARMAGSAQPEPSTFSNRLF